MLYLWFTEKKTTVIMIEMNHGQLQNDHIYLMNLTASI